MALVLVLFLGISETSLAQNASEKFGRNRIQHENFEWRFLDSDNFDVYFYEGSDAIAREVIEYLESEFERITDLIGYPPYSKTKVFLYNSVEDLQQSNVGLNDYGLTAGGETKFVKSYIEVANPGSMSLLKEELLYKVSGAIVNEMMYGGNLKDMFQSSVLLNLPEWFIDGAAMYVAKGWSIEMDDFMRELIETKKPKKLDRLRGKDALLAGQSVWNFISEKYGRGAMANILNYTRIIRNEEKSVTITLGVSFDQLMNDWYNFYSQSRTDAYESYTMPPEDQLLEKNKKDVFLNHVKINADGTRMAYTRNNNGHQEVIVRDLANGKEETVMSLGYKVADQEVDYTMPVIDWADTTRLGIIHTRTGGMTFTLYDVNTKSKLPRRLDRFEQINSLSFSDNGRLFIISGVVRGKNDLYLLSTLRDRTKRLTDDFYDDITPVFVPGSNTVIFSSNRISDSLNVKDDSDLEEISENYNLFAYNLDTTTNVLTRITNTVSRDTDPYAINENQVLYLSNQKGITNLFLYNLQTGIYTQATNFASSISSYDFFPEQNDLVYILADDLEQKIYFNPSFDYRNQIFTPQTRRQQMLQAREFQKKRQEQRTSNETIEDIVKRKLNREERQQVVDTIRVDSLQTLPMQEIIPEPEKPKKDPNVINTDDYTFDESVKEKDQPSTADNFLAQYRNRRTGSNVSGPFPYEPRFSADNLQTTFIIDPIRNFGIKLETQMADMLGNHKFTGGVMMTTDLRSGDIFGEYQYLKYLLDYSIGFERNVIFWDQGNNLHKYSKNSINFGVAYPFSPRTRVSIKPQYTFTTFNDLEAIPQTPPEFTSSQTNHYVGAEVAFVFDNSTINGMNLIEGTRAKASFMHYEGINSSDISFSNLSVDIRHYQKIYKHIVFATRAYYGSFFGRSPKQYLLGGMDNWIVNETNTEGNNNPLDPSIDRNNTDLLFVKFATNLRGFDYATLVGENTLLFNAELRIPLIRTIQNGPIASNFFKNLQFIGFFDIGSAWTGASPFESDNNISSVVIPNDPADRELSNFIIELKNFRNPWLYSYGAGLRTTLLGYYVKFDVAWPVEDYETGSATLHVTLGFDF
jgi:Tol biopolymer transport system component